MKRLCARDAPDADPFEHLSEEECPLTEAELREAAENSATDDDVDPFEEVAAEECPLTDSELREAREGDQVEEWDAQSIRDAYPRTANVRR